MSIDPTDEFDNETGTTNLRTAEIDGELNAYDDLNLQTVQFNITMDHSDVQSGSGKVPLQFGTVSPLGGASGFMDRNDVAELVGSRVTDLAVIPENAGSLQDSGEQTGDPTPDFLRFEASCFLQPHNFQLDPGDTNIPPDTALRDPDSTDFTDSDVGLGGFSEITTEIHHNRVYYANGTNDESNGVGSGRSIQTAGSDDFIWWRDKTGIGPMLFDEDELEFTGSYAYRAVEQNTETYRLIGKYHFLWDLFDTGRSGPVQLTDKDVSFRESPIGGR